jgi:hypothetical protein
MLRPHNSKDGQEQSTSFVESQAIRASSTFSGFIAVNNLVGIKDMEFGLSHHGSALKPLHRYLGSHVQLGICNIALFKICY